MDAFPAKSDLKMPAFKPVLPEVIIARFSLWNQTWTCDLKKETIQQKLHYNSHCHTKKKKKKEKEKEKENLWDSFCFQSLLPVKMLDTQYRRMKSSLPTG